ncbi:LysR substrate-binding domain-containing protein [Marinobacterium rhizophilum]|uniref:LysR family transcriptional regulator n=1 Tax=Marinobacterium rhizophilum TaxID=420402 RepID=A0ABY5HKR5_9GAMM|nr:LysR substrate-binding domain-containing protein [Marinobacterium rhizophilum]UTW12893.1 LysR family transcriptional regulator [Marinobacterium rhizophilum]
MKSGLPPLHCLKTFEVAARLLNFSAAARELNMTQSAVSQQVRLLEHHLGEPLFNRKHRRVSLTNKGMSYLPVVQSTLNGLRRSTADIFSPVSSGELVIEVNMAFAWGWLAPRLHSFCSRYPWLRLEIRHSNWDHDFGKEPVDLAIRHGRGNWTGHVSKPLLTPRLKAYCAAPLAKLLHEPMDLLSLPLIDVSGTHKMWVDWFQNLGIDDSAALKHRVDSVAMAISMAQSGLGVFLGYEELVHTTSLRDKLHAPFDIWIETADNYHLTYPEGRPLSRAAEAFVQWITAELTPAAERN